MLLGMTLSLYLTAKRRWFWAGLCGALGALAWQPGAAFPLITFILALCAARQERRRAVVGVFAGVVLPLAAIVLYYAERRALPALADGAVIFNLLYLNRGAQKFIGALLKPIRIVSKYYRPLIVPIALGLAAYLPLCVERVRRRVPLRAFLTTDRYASVLITLPMPFLWSFMDFQSYPDFYVFLPYVALGVAWSAESALR